MVKIGVISDTHGYLRPGILDVFKNVDLILHAGDIGDLKTYHTLMGIAPVEAVWGNMDPFSLRKEIRETLVLTKNTLTIALSHGGGSPDTIIERLQNVFYSHSPNIIVFGHTHQPMAEYIGETFFFNPGYARETLGLLHIDDKGGFTAEIVKL